MIQEFEKDESGEYKSLLYQECIDKSNNRSEKTLYEMFEKRVRESGANDLFGVIENNNMNYSNGIDTWKKVERISEFLKLETKLNQLVGIFAANSPEWFISEFAFYAVSCTIVPIVHNLKDNMQVKNIFMNSKISLCFISEEKAHQIYQMIKAGELPFLKTVVLFGDDEKLVEMLNDCNIEVHCFADLLQTPLPCLSTSDEVKERFPCKEDDLAMICYTSGTSGKSKGVKLTHKVFMTQISAFECLMENNKFPDISKQETRHFSYLPRGHVLETIVSLVVINLGGVIVFFSGDRSNFLEEIKMARPILLAVVPRVLNTFEQKIRDKIKKKNFFVRFLFKIGMLYKDLLSCFGFYKSWIFDSLIFNKIAEEFGGRIEIVLCGGALAVPETLSFFQNIFSCKIIQGYGQTETTAASILQSVTSVDTSKVGIPFPSTKVRMLPFENLDGEKEGELLIGGKALMSGYHDIDKDPFTVINDEKWIRTGDLVTFNGEEFQIIGRDKSYFKTSFGEYLSTEKIENVLIDFNNISDVFIPPILGSDNICAVVVVENESLSKDDIFKLITERASEAVKKGILAKYEVPIACVISRVPFAELNDGKLVTPTMKKRSFMMVEYFGNQIEDEFKKLK